MRVEDLAVGVVLGERFRLERILGHGSYGDVWLASVVDEPELPRKVALKVYLPDQQVRATKVLLQESCTAQGFNHERLVRVFGAARIDGLVVMWMEYVEGPTLHQRLGNDGQPQPVSLAEALGWLREIAEGLAYLHVREPPVVHGDLKLDNILLQPGVGARLLDFGQSRAIEDRFVATDGTGALPYLAPEVMGRGADGQGRRYVPSDIYAFGCIAYRFLTGRFPRRTWHEVINLTPFPRPCGLNPSIPKSIEEVVLKCLEKRPENRYGDGAALLAAVDSLRAHLDKETLVQQAPTAAKDTLPTAAAELADLTEGLLEEGRAEEAAEKLEQAMQRMSTSPRLLMLYAAAARRVEKIDAARLVYQRAVAWLRNAGAPDEELRDAVEGCAELDVKLKRYEEAAAGYQWLVERWPEKRWYLYRHGVTLGLAGRYPGSIEALQQLHENGPKTGLVCAKIGLAYLQSRDTETAVQYFNEALMLDADEPTALFQLGRIRWLQGRPDKAEFCLQRLEQVDGAADSAKDLGRLLRGG